MKVYILNDSDGDPLVPHAVFFNRKDAIEECRALAAEWNAESKHEEPLREFTDECGDVIVSAWEYQGEEFCLTVTEVETVDEP